MTTTTVAPSSRLTVRRRRTPAPPSRCKLAGRLVGEQHPRQVGERDARSHPLLLAAGHLSAAAVGAVRRIRAAVLRRRPAAPHPETRVHRGGEGQAIHRATTAPYSDSECHRSTELDLSPITPGHPPGIVRAPARYPSPAMRNPSPCCSSCSWPCSVRVWPDVVTKSIVYVVVSDSGIGLDGPRRRRLDRAPEAGVALDAAARGLELGRQHREGRLRVGRHEREVVLDEGPHRRGGPARRVGRAGLGGRLVTGGRALARAVAGALGRGVEVGSCDALGEASLRPASLGSSSRGHSSHAPRPATRTSATSAATQPRDRPRVVSAAGLGAGRRGGCRCLVGGRRRRGGRSRPGGRAGRGAAVLRRWRRWSGGHHGRGLVVATGRRGASDRSPRARRRRSSRTFATGQRCAGSLTSIAASSPAAGWSSGSRGGSSWTIL